MPIDKIVDTASVIIVNNQGEFLLQKKSLDYPWFPGKWCCFGGGIELGEKPEEAASREMGEEGMNVRDIKFFRKREYRDECSLGVRKGTQYVFIANYLGKVEDINIKEGAGFAFFAEQELSKMDGQIVEHDLESIRMYAQSRKS